MVDKKVIPIKPLVNPAEGLRNIANMIDSGELDVDEITLVAGTEVFHLGVLDDSRAAEGAIFNLTVGVHKLMKPVLD